MKNRTIWGATALVGVLSLFGAVIVPSAADAASLSAAPAPTDTASPSADAPSPRAGASSPSADASSGNPLGAKAQLTAEAAAPLTVQGNINSRKLDLRNGMFDFDPNQPAPDVLGLSTVTYSRTASYVAGEPSTTPHMEVSYQIALMGGQGTNYWVHMYAGVEVNGDSVTPSPVVQCQITVGGAYQHGGQPPTDAVPYICETDAQHVQAHPSDKYLTTVVDFTVRNNLDAEVQSTVITTGSVSLDKGYWEVNAGNKWGGSTEVAANSSAHMDALLREGEGDEVIDKTTARAIFAYRILVDGVVTPYWVMGTNQVLRARAFHHDASCTIYDQNPIPASGEPVPAAANFSPFTCSMNAYRPESWNGNWQTDFTLSAAPVTTVTTPIRLSELLQHCGDQPNDCNTDLATVTRVPGPVSPNDQKSTLNNLTDHDQTQKLTVSTTHGVTNTVGAKVTATTMLGLYEVAVEASYSIAISNSTTYTSETDVTAPPFTRVWLEQTPILVHVVGNVLVRQDGRYFLLPNIAADFPEKDGHSETTIRSQHLPHLGAQLQSASAISAVVSTADSAVAGQAIGLTGGAFDLPVDSSGPITDTSTPAELTLAANGSTTWSTREHQSNPAASGGAITRGSFSYRITQNNVPGTYWIEGTAVNGYNADGTRNASATCQVYLGDPNADGVPASTDAPYQCVTTVTPPNAQNLMEVAFSVGPRPASTTPASPVPTPTTIGVTAEAGAHLANASGLADTGSSVNGAGLLAGLLALLVGAGMMITRRRARRS
ncbi:MAG: LPXTG cell wall anchor domain-containing protein [Microbacteriaceae bacterium]